MILYGASGQAKVVYDLLLAAGTEVEYLVDDFPPKTFLDGLQVNRPSDELLQGKEVIIAIGDNVLREHIFSKIKDRCRFRNALHPSAAVSRFSTVGSGTVVMAQAAVNADVQIGAHCIINTGAVVEHDCRIEDFVHISPNASLAGNVHVKKGAHVGLNACVLQGVTIGAYATVGAGATVLKDVPDYAVVVGNPARKIKMNIVEDGK